MNIGDAREQARIEALCAETNEVLATSQAAYDAAVTDLDAAIADARSEEARGYATDETTPQALVDAEALLPGEQAKDSSQACTTGDDATGRKLNHNTVLMDEELLGKTEKGANARFLTPWIRPLFGV